MMCNMKKMIASHRLTCDMIGVATPSHLRFVFTRIKCDNLTPGRTVDISLGY